MTHFYWTWKNRIQELFRRIRSIPYRLKKGFWPSDLWNLDITFAKFITPRLKGLKLIKHGYPSDITPEEWDIILDKMIWSFEKSANEFWWSDEYFDSINNKTSEHLTNKHQEGLDLFAKYYNALWD